MVGKVGPYWYERPPWGWERPFPWALIAVYAAAAACIALAAVAMWVVAT